MNEFLDWNTLKDFLESKVAQFNTIDFIADDPISIPHSFSKKEDIEISALLSATIAWGNRKSIVKNAHRMMEYLDHAPYDFVKNHLTTDLNRLSGFVHRTFNDSDFKAFAGALKVVYEEHKGLEGIFTQGFKKGGADVAIHHFRSVFVAAIGQKRSEKHVSDPLAGSSAKRLNMFLRWMVRTQNTGVDFGLWKKIPPSKLSIPLDVHSGTIARRLGLLARKQNDWKAVEELDAALRKMDPMDPVKYDFALFGLGAIEKF